MPIMLTQTFKYLDRRSVSFFYSKPKPANLLDLNLFNNENIILRNDNMKY